MLFEQLARYGRPELALILVLISAIVLAPAATYLVLPKAKAYSAVTLSRSQLIAATTAEVDLAGRLDDLREEIGALDRHLNGDMSGTPRREIESYVIGRLQVISWRNRIKLGSVEPREGESIETFDEMLFNVSISGDYFDLYNWLRDLDDELGFVVVKQYRIASANGNSPQLTAELTIASYRATAS